MRRGLSLAAVAMLAGCDPAPHAPAYFDAHPAEIDPTLAGCAAGRIRGGECTSAEAGRAHRAADARIRFFKRAYEGR